MHGHLKVKLINKHKKPVNSQSCISVMYGCSLSCLLQWASEARLSGHPCYERSSDKITEELEMIWSWHDRGLFETPIARRSENKHWTYFRIDRLALQFRTRHFINTIIILTLYISTTVFITQGNYVGYMFRLLDSHLQAYSLQVKSQDAVHTLGSQYVYISGILKPYHLPYHLPRRVLLSYAISFA